MLRLPSRARGAGLGAAGLGPGGEAGFGAAATGQSHSGPARPGPAKVSSSGEPGHSVGTDSAPRPGLRERVSLQLAAHERPREDGEAPRRRQSPGLRPRVQSAGVSLESGGSQRSREGPLGPPSSWSRTTRRGPETPGPGARGQSPGGGRRPRAAALHLRPRGSGGPRWAFQGQSAPRSAATCSRPSRAQDARPQGRDSSADAPPPPFGGSVLALRPLPARWRPGDRAPHLASEGGAQAEGEADPKAGSSAAGSR